MACLIVSVILLLPPHSNGALRIERMGSRSALLATSKWLLNIVASIAFSAFNSLALSGSIFRPLTLVRFFSVLRVGGVMSRWYVQTSMLCWRHVNANVRMTAPLFSFYCRSNSRWSCSSLIALCCHWEPQERWSSDDACPFAHYSLGHCAHGDTGSWVLCAARSKFEMVTHSKTVEVMVVFACRNMQHRKHSILAYLLYRVSVPLPALNSFCTGSLSFLLLNYRRWRQRLHSHSIATASSAAGVLRLCFSKWICSGQS